MNSWLIAAMIVLNPVVTLTCRAKELDRRCLEGDCVILSVKNGRVFAERTGEFAGKRDIAGFDKAGVSFVPAAEAPIKYVKTDRGWTAVVSAFLPREYDFDAPELRLYIFDPQENRQIAAGLYNFLGRLDVGAIFLGHDTAFVLASSTGTHAYVVRTRIWLLPLTGVPELVLDVPGLLNRIQQATSGKAAGLWIDRQTYDGMQPRDERGEARILGVESRSEDLCPLQRTIMAFVGDLRLALYDGTTPR